MNIYSLKAVFIGILAISCTATANASLISRLGGQAFYDDTLDITWLANANLSATNTFGVAGINTDGSMSSYTANNWIAAMNSDGVTGYLGVNNWRLPTLSPINGSNFNTTLTTNALSDRGYATSVGWLDVSGNTVSEMGHMYYVNLGNLGRKTPNSSNPNRNVVQAGWGLINTAPFSNLMSGYYWFDTGSTSNSEWHFDFNDGAQSNSFDKSLNMYAWAVHSGDIAASAVPVPAAAWLFVSGLLGLASVSCKRRH